MQTEILVTGGEGLLGKALRDVCPEAVFVSRKDCELKDLTQTEHLFEIHKPKKVLHLAAETGGIKLNQSNGTELFESNLLINTNVLRAAKEHGVQRLISILAGCAFQFSTTSPSAEEDLHKGFPFSGSLGFGYSKRALDVHTRLIRKQYGFEYSTMTPVTIYGPFDNWDLETGHVMGSLIHKCFLAKQRNGSLEVWGSGRAMRQFVYSLDVARLLIRALDSFTDAETVVVAPDNGITIKDLAHLIAKVVEFDGPIIFNTSKPEGESIKLLRSNKFNRLFPDFSFTPLEEGLKKTVAWFCENYPTFALKGQT